MISESTRIAAPFDALLMPTIPLLAPPIDSVEHDDQRYNQTDNAILRNTSVVNFLDGCALTIPCHEAGAGPVGLMLVGQGDGDRRLFAVGLAVEAALQSSH